MVGLHKTCGVDMRVCWEALKISPFFLGEHRKNPPPPLLTVHVHSYGLDGRWPQAILSLAVVAASLVALDVGYPQRFIEDTRVLKSVRGTSRCFGPPDLSKHQKKDCYLKLQFGDLTSGWRARSTAETWGTTQAPVGATELKWLQKNSPLTNISAGTHAVNTTRSFWHHFHPRQGHIGKYFQNSDHQPRF